MVTIVISLICLLFSLMSLLIFGINKKEIVGVQIESPNNLDPIEVALIYNKKVNVTDIVSIIPYFYSNGYLKMEQFNNDILLTKLREYDGKKINCKLIFDSIFENKSVVKYSDLLRDIKIRADFNLIMDSMNSKNVKYKIFDKKSIFLKKVSKILNYIAIEVFSLIILNFSLASIVYSVFPIFALFIIGSGNEVEIGFGENRKIKKGKDRILSNFLLGGMIIGFIIVPELFFTKSKENLIFYVISYLIVILSQFISSFIDKRTKFGNENYCTLLRFKDYLDNVEKKPIEVIIKDDKNYMSKVMTYGYMLGISKDLTSYFDDYFGGLFNLYGNMSSSFDNFVTMENMVLDYNRIIIEEKKQLTLLLSNGYDYFLKE